MAKMLKVLIEHWKALRRAETLIVKETILYLIESARFFGEFSDVEMLVASGALSAYPERWR